MKARLFLSIALLAAMSCQHEQRLPDSGKDNPDQTGTVWKLTLQATLPDAASRALDLSSDGRDLQVYWKQGDKVQVYWHGAWVGTLTATPGSGEKPLDATLSGTIDSDNMAIGEKLTLLVAPEAWDYTGQNGLLSGTGSLEDAFDFSTATVTTCSFEDGFVSVEEESVSFTNGQSIYRFSFGDLPVQEFQLSAQNGALVQSRTLDDSGAWVSTFGPLSVTPAEPSEAVFVSLRNESQEADQYRFVITGSDGALYLATKNIPAGALDAPGRFISGTIRATQPDFSPRVAGAEEIGDLIL